MQQPVQMRQRLADGEAELHHVQLAGEHRVHHLDASARCLGAIRQDQVQPVLVMLTQIGNALMHTGERRVVRGQHQRVGRQVGKTVEAAEVTRQRVAVGLLRPQRDVGADARQDDVAGDQQPVLRAGETGMLRAMPLADDDLPAAIADADRLAAEHTAIGRRDRLHPFAVASDPFQQGGHLFRADAGAGVEGPCHFLAAAIILGALVAAIEPFRLRHPQRRIPALGQPAGLADMIGVKMRDQDARHRAAIQRGGEHALPQGAGLLAADAGIDDGPALAILQQPEVDVVQREGQRHAQPVHAVSHAHRRAALGQLAEPIVDFRLHALFVSPLFVAAKTSGPVLDGKQPA